MQTLARAVFSVFSIVERQTQINGSVKVCIRQRVVALQLFHNRRHLFDFTLQTHNLLKSVFLVSHN
tara:strand:+ start:1482 stop:1679 length:198 start_codon:yes stop_codon:yes gene_type:complete